MKKHGILNAQLARIVASMGHGDRLVIGDSGLPVPAACEKVDLMLTTHIPRFVDTLRVVLEELEVERAIVADEMSTHSATLLAAVQELLPGVPIDRVPHEAFKQQMHDGATVACVRTGEATPYANIMLVAGVTFG